MLKDLILDTSGKSNAYFFKNSNKALRIKKINILKFLKQKSNKRDVRLCLHGSKNSQGQCMINLIQKKKFYIPHFHNYSDEYYVALSGKLKLIKFNNSLKVKDVIVINSKETFLSKVNKGDLHVTLPVGKRCIYLEFRSGTFITHKNTYKKEKFLTTYLDKL